MDANELSANTAPASAAAERLTQLFLETGIKTQIIHNIDNDTEFTEAVVLDRETPTEPVARLYRGVNSAESATNQVPYAMRYQDEQGNPAILSDVRTEVERLAYEPTYANLLAYAEKVRPYLTSQRDILHLERGIAEIEEAVLSGRSVREELLWQQLGHNGGVFDTGITPYISATFDPLEALGYSSIGSSFSALLVIDVPLSAFDDLYPDGNEVRLKGALEPGNITAVLIRSRRIPMTRGEQEHEVAAILEQVDTTVHVPLITQEDLQRQRESRVMEHSQSDHQQWEIDVEAVSQSRIARLTTLFPEAESFAAIPPQNASSGYLALKHAIFDHYAQRLEATAHGTRQLKNYDYEEPLRGHVPFDRERITESMLMSLRNLVTRIEGKERERQEYRDAQRGLVQREA